MHCLAQYSNGRICCFVRWMRELFSISILVYLTLERGTRIVDIGLRTLGNLLVSQVTAIYLRMRLFHSWICARNQSFHKYLWSLRELSAIWHSVLYFSIHHKLQTTPFRIYLYEKRNGSFTTVHIQYDNHFIAKRNNVSAIICKLFNGRIFQVNFFRWTRRPVLLNHWWN